MISRFDVSVIYYNQTSRAFGSHSADGQSRLEAQAAHVAAPVALLLERVSS